MKHYALLFLLGASASLAIAQQPPPPPLPPAFAAPNLSSSGVRSMAANCAACHGTNGRAASGVTLPGLAGYDKEKFVTVFKEFREGKRPATLMHQIAKGYGDAEVAAMADYFSKLPR